MMVTGRDFEGSSLRRFLRVSKGLRFFSLSTAWSRPRSLTGLKVPSNRVRMSWRWVRGWVVVVVREKRIMNRIVAGLMVSPSSVAGKWGQGVRVRFRGFREFEVRFCLGFKVP